MLSYDDNSIKIVDNHDYLECDYKEEFHYYFITRNKDLDAVREMKYLDGSYPSVPISKPICEYKDMCKAESDKTEYEMNKKDLIASLINAVEEWLEETQGESTAIISGHDYYLLSNKFMAIPDIENLYKGAADKEE